ncbi:unnamed protein product [Medioppia subpectinata]|uniref:Uncharacterized protein n=1 Tax=Medioppia subpectinata TaxID=1979941 RepID=A0A7R9PT58_9ACAR|nr:unnamed protein product [Medioppia subpectinata]CAG2100321.1 unnamed protein product [Medioppia subpectinata]
MITTGLAGADTQVHTYASTGTLLDLRNTKRVDETEENWPKDVTAAMRMADNTVYLFRGEKYCKRSWKCKDGDCCKEWKNAMNLFHCPGTKESESRNYKDNKNGDQNDGEEETELQKPKAKPTEEPPPEPITEEPIKKPNIKQSKKTTDPPNDDEDYVVKKDSKKSRKNGPRPDQIRPTPRRRH